MERSRDGRKAFMAAGGESRGEESRQPGGGARPCGASWTLERNVSPLCSGKESPGRSWTGCLCGLVPRPHSHVEVEAPCGAVTRLTFRPAAPLLLCPQRAGTLPPAPRYKESRRGRGRVESGPLEPCAVSLSFGASSAAERGDGNLPGYLRIEFCDPWMVPVPGPGVETERAPVPVVPAVTYPFSGSGPGWKRWCGKGWEEGGSQGARGRDTWQGHVRARPSPGPSQGWLPRICTQQPWVRWGIRRAWAAAGPGSCGAGGRGEARPRTVPVCAGRGPEPGHWAVKPRGPPSLLSAARGPVPSVVELPTRLSLAVPASLVRSLRTPSDGRIPPVGTPCQLPGTETDGRGWRPGGPRG